MLSNYSKNLKKKLCIENFKIEKLVPNLFNKTKYVTHYRNIKFYLEQGLKLLKVYKILQFEQFSWLKSYIEFNTEKRKNAKSEFEKNFFKLMNNSVFGKTMENVRKRIKCEVVINEKRRSKLISSPCYENLNIINDEVVVIKSKQIEVELKKPIYCGFTILDLSNVLMYDYMFDVQNNFRYIDKLQDLVNNYNNTIHKTIKMKPIDAIKPENTIY